MKIQMLILLPLILVACISEKPKEIISEAELLNQVILALGGYDSIKAINTQELYGHYIEPGYNLLVKAKVQKMRPNFRVIGDPKEIGFAEGFDGASWEYFDGQSKRTSGEAEAATRRGAEFDYPFIDWKEKGHQVLLVGQTEIGSKKLYQLQVTLSDGWVLQYFIDPVTFLPLYYRKAMPLHAVGENIDYLVSLSDFRKVGGLLIPFTSVERNIKTGAMVNSTIYDSIKVNMPFDLAQFSPPTK